MASNVSIEGSLDLPDLKVMRLIALALAAALLAGACGGGGDEDDAAEGPGVTVDEAPVDDEFCNTVVEAEASVLAASAGGFAGDPAPLIDKAEKTAPDELQEPMAVVAAAAREAIETRDDSAFRTPKFSENEEEVDVWVADNCGFESVHVEAVEYAFEGVPATLPAGMTTFHFSNEGEEIHEMLMVRFKDETTTIEDLAKLSDEEAADKIDFLGASFGPPGSSDTESRDLTPGRYALVCFVPVGSTDEATAANSHGPPHVAEGMSVEFTAE